jgi:hypothetical protein
MMDSPIEYRKRHRISGLDSPMIFDKGLINTTARRVQVSVIIRLKLHKEDKTSFLFSYLTYRFIMDLYKVRVTNKLITNCHAINVLTTPYCSLVKILVKKGVHNMEIAFCKKPQIVNQIPLLRTIDIPLYFVYIFLII